MAKQLFRKKSIDRITSPEQLHDYMRVTTPRLWMILSVILALLIGLIVLSATLKMENTIEVKANVEDNDVYIALTDKQAERVKPGMEVRIGEAKGHVQYMYMDEDEHDLIVFMDQGIPAMEDGVYDASIVTETTTPISFLLN